MSAFIVSDEHLNYLVSFATDNRVTWWDGHERPCVGGNEQRVFNTLFRANVESVNERYDESLPPMPSKFRYRADTTLVQVLKACACFDYQACETEDYDESEACTIINEIRKEAIRKLDGYEEALWEINDPPAKKVKTGMPLLTKEVLDKIPALYSQDGRGGQALAVVKFFDPTGSWTWYASEGSYVCPEHGNYDCTECPKPWKNEDFMFFGLVVGAETEFGYFSLKELQGWPCRMGLGIERDLGWKPKTFAEISGKAGVL